MKKASLYIMAAIYVAAGINHFVHPAVYISIMPTWIGWHQWLVAVSGILEILFGLMLIPRSTQVIAAWCIIALLIAVFPANIQMMLNYWQQHKQGLWLTIVRLPLQLVLIWWAYGYTKNVRPRIVS